MCIKESQLESSQAYATNNGEYPPHYDNDDSCECDDGCEKCVAFKWVNGKVV